EPQTLLTHYQEAGNLEAAFAAACDGASVAEGQLAFDRAAAFLQTALAAAPELPPAARGPLYRRLGMMLGLAGRGRESADAYLRAAASAPDDDFRQLAQRAATEQLMRSGHIDEGVKLLERVAGALGLRTPPTAAAAVRGMASARVRTRATLLWGVPAT